MQTAVLVGCGAMSDGWLSALRDVPELAAGIRLAGLVDLDLGTAKARAAKHNLDVATGTDLAAMLQDLKPDLVFDLVIPAARAQVVKTALAHGAHVLSEKPMANSLDEARDLITAAAQANRLHAVIQNRRFLPGIRRIKQALPLIGELTAVHVDFFIGAHFGGFRDQMEHVLLLDMAIHTFDAARWIIDRPATGVYARETNPKGSWYAHGASADALFDFEGGVTMTYRGSWCAEGANTAWEASWRIIGTEGTILWDGNEGITAHRVNGTEGFFRPLTPVDIPPAPPMVEGHAGVILDFLRAVETRSKPLTEGRDNIRSLAMVFAAIDSATTGAPTDMRPL
ncbi:Gfo/Idh/MocA family oxidoreductase [Rhodobacter sp. KR11]|uniref:Gfo/Idh/MocA family protein n=1 Tax=Rhodobacter sp. KR11 TaxID=2974588 RepID=UPI002221525F|nr:Gfo/Idh/MocA family oxidoreductase [Rhodobacter sp. KR11]MCW1920384.1 Gfo/Idh/MocA family oxidoreductase [Rhodobacter sp. KR11]